MRQWLIGSIILIVFMMVAIAIKDSAEYNNSSYKVTIMTGERG